MINLTGKWFLEIIDSEKGKCRWHGRIEGKADDKTYLVMLYDWIVGVPNDEILLKVEDMMNFEFFDCIEDLNYRYKVLVQHK